ncbi:hypothetical protein QQ045_004294 [Rhodiola kirilowii]
MSGNIDMSEEFIEELVFDNSMEERRHELFNQIYGEGSSITNRRVICRDREAGHERLHRDYFAENPVYPLETFRRRFRMGRHVFLRIVDALSNFDPYFQQRVDALGRRGLSPLQKCTASIRMLAYGIGADAVDDYVRIGKSTAIECLKTFATDVISIFESEYLRKPNSNDVQRLLKMGEARCFPGMMGSIDCMHWQWKNCPKAWKGMFMNGHKGVPTILLEVVASSDLWIWHAFFGVAGSNNDINVLDRSPVFDDVLEGRAPEVNYTVNGNNYNMGYYLTDGIYPEWATFVKTIPRPQGEKRKLFSKYQEGQRKDVERAFGVLQSRFAIIRGPARFWDKADLAKIMRACIILHNMIVEDERDTYATPFGPLPSYDDATNGLPPPNLGEEPLAPYERYIERNVQIRDRQKHRQLQSDLIEHIATFHNSG